MHREGGEGGGEGGGLIHSDQTGTSQPVTQQRLAMFLWDRSWEVLVGFYLGVATNKEGRHCLSKIGRSLKCWGLSVWRWTSAVRLSASGKLSSVLVLSGQQGSGTCGWKGSESVVPLSQFP